MILFLHLTVSFCSLSRWCTFTQWASEEFQPALCLTLVERRHSQTLFLYLGLILLTILSIYLNIVFDINHKLKTVPGIWGAEPYRGLNKPLVQSSWKDAWPISFFYTMNKLLRHIFHSNVCFLILHFHTAPTTLCNFHSPFSAQICGLLPVLCLVGKSPSEWESGPAVGG